MLRLALIENLRRVAARIGADRRDRNIADVWVDQIDDNGCQRKSEGSDSRHR